MSTRLTPNHGRCWIAGAGIMGIVPGILMRLPRTPCGSGTGDVASCQMLNGDYYWDHDFPCCASRGFANQVPVGVPSLRPGVRGIKVSTVIRAESGKGQHHQH